MEDYPIVPGRGLVTRDAIDMRIQYLKNKGFSIEAISGMDLEPELIKNNIESLIGSVEIPLGLVGPLLFNNDGINEMVFTAAGTLEGALVASMNRGAKAISKSGGFNAAVVHQKMIRSPLFIFNNLSESVIFKNWIEKQFDKIKNITELYSNHANLQSIQPFVTGKGVHLKFVYTTGDASGQNMTTTCTWHGVLWINKTFTEQCGIEPVRFVIEGNGASDKKVSHFSMLHGRGVHVISECELDEQVIEKILRTNSDDFIHCINQSRVQNQLDGMIGYNINVANAIAAIYVATGQDLASIHESAVGILNIEKSERGLYCSLNLPSLVIGTLGGGTHLPAQREALRIMNCDGSGKVERFAKLIAGFALSLEISTFAAIVGGQFAKSHEKLGRNKPINWLTKSELNKTFIQKCLNGYFENYELISVRSPDVRLIDNGITITLTSRINKKLIGFVSFEVELKNKLPPGATEKKLILLKSKALDAEVIKGLYLMAASIEPLLADMLFQYQDILEYKYCHKKELILYKMLHINNKRCMPEFYGSKTDEVREAYLLFFENLDYSELIAINSENKPEIWSVHHVKSAIRTITEVHQLFAVNSFHEMPPEIMCFEPWSAIPLYETLAKIILKEHQDEAWAALIERLFYFINDLEREYKTIGLEKTIVHNDFNPRNVCIRKDNTICIYDWELAVINFPHRDIVEFLSFVLPENFEESTFKEYIKYHYSLQKTEVPWSDWKMAYLYSLKEYIVTRVSFYMAGRILMDYEFAVRIFLNCFRMIEFLQTF